MVKEMNEMGLRGLIVKRKVGVSLVFKKKQINQS